MNANAIQIVTKALQDLLTPVVGDIYIGPLDDPDGTNAKAVLFLYRVAANAHLRNAEHVVAGATPGDPPMRYDGALPLDLYYLLTAGSSQSGGELPALTVLGQAMQVLNETPYLVGLPLRGEMVRVSLDSPSTEDMARIWSLFPAANYRTSVTYVVTPVWIDPSRPAVEGAPVTREPHRVGHLQGTGAGA